jgi:membrane protein
MKTETPGQVTIASALIELAREMTRRGSRLRLEQAAGSLAFLSMLAIVPMFSIGFAVLTALPIFDELREALDRFLDGNLFPEAFSNTLLSHLGEFAAGARQLSLAGSVFFFVTAFTTLLTVEATLNRIWDTRRQRGLARRLVLYWALLTLGPLVLGTSLTFNGLFVGQLLGGSAASELRTLWTILLPSTTTFIGLTLLYRLLPAGPVRWGHAACGALLAACLFELLRRGMTLYVAYLPSYTIVFGAFASLPLFLLWLFFGWLALLGGALLAASLRRWRLPPANPALDTPGGRFESARAALVRMIELAGSDPQATVQAGRLAAGFGNDTEYAREMAALLASTGYIVRYAPIDRKSRSRQPEAVSIWEERWGWARPPVELDLRALFESQWKSRESSRFEPGLLDRPLVENRPQTIGEG